MSNLTRPAFIETSIPHTKLEVNTDFIKARVYPNGLAEIILDRPKVRYTRFMSNLSVAGHRA